MLELWRCPVHQNDLCFDVLGELLAASAILEDPGFASTLILICGLHVNAFPLKQTHNFFPQGNLVEDF